LQPAIFHSRECNGRSHISPASAATTFANRAAGGALRAGISLEFRCAKNLIFLSRLRLIWAVQTSAQKYFVLLEAQISRSSWASRLTRGAYRDRHGR
jgi:hypothetical protein